MAYRWDLGNHQSVYLDHRAGQTTVTVVVASPGQQQQSSNCFQTGAWTAPPQALQTSSGIVLQLHTAQGLVWLQVQGQSIYLSQQPTPLHTQPLPMQEVDVAPGMASMPPMQPMQPMQMGNMSMSLNPMEMRMGDMEMRMGTPATPTPTPTTTKFCRQCGAAVQPDDRFCSKCGTRLQ